MSRFFLFFNWKKFPFNFSNWWRMYGFSCW